MNILILGSTGSIGKQTIEVIKKLNHHICGISYFNNFELAQEQIKNYHIKYYYSPNYANESNVSDFDDLIIKSKPNLVVNAVSGYVGLKLTISCLLNHKEIALANKESLVMAGFFINQLKNKNHVNIYPIDSEHSSLYELLIDKNINNVNQLIITCSGGRYYNYSKQDLAKITYEEAIKHPNWNMGSKISIDSATLINKCFEIVEAYWLFDFKQIIALYHPQSIVHSMVEFKDYSIVANMSQPDMKIAIQNAINKFSYFKSTSVIDQLKFNNLTLTFDYIDTKKWKPIQWAYDIINDQKHNLGIIINVSNDIAIRKFKQNLIRFDQIIDYIEANIKKYHQYDIDDINDVFNLIKLIESESN